MPQRRKQKPSGLSRRRAQNPALKFPPWSPAAPGQKRACAPKKAPVGANSNGFPYEWMASFDELAEPVFIHDKQFRILRCNAAYAACAGQPMEAIIGKPYWQVFPKAPPSLGENPEIPNAELAAAASEFTSEAGEVFLTHDITVHRASGEFWYSRHLLENITERRREEKLEKVRSSFFEAIISGAPGIFMVTDKQGNLLHWNAGLNALTGCVDAQLKKSSAFAFVAQDDRSGMQSKLQEALITGEAHGDVRVESHEGIRDIFFSARRFELAGEPYLVSFAIDKSEIRQLEHELTREKALSDTIIESAPGAFFMVDQDMKLVRWNRILNDEVGMTDKQLRGALFHTVIHEPDRPLATAKMLAAFATGYADFEVRVPTPQGLKYYLKTARRFEVDGAPFVAGFCLDLTERKLAEESLIREKAFSDALIDSAPGAFFVIDGHGDFYRWNSYMNQLTGLSNKELSRRSWLLTVIDEDRPLAAGMMRDALAYGFAQADLRIESHDWGVRIFSMTARRFKVDEATYLVGVGVDNSDQIARLTTLEHEAQTDSLTQIAARGYFLKIAKNEFERCRRYGHPFSLWMLDIDHFKRVNDAYGHQAGDIALQSLVKTSHEVLRDWDIIGRMGGEEFAVLLPETDANQALEAAERFRKRVGEVAVPLDTDKTVHMTISTGVATSRADDGDVKALLDRADQALYEAKRSGRNKVCVAECPLSLPVVHVLPSAPG